MAANFTSNLSGLVNKLWRQNAFFTKGSKFPLEKLSSGSYLVLCYRDRGLYKLTQHINNFKCIFTINHYLLTVFTYTYSSLVPESNFFGHNLLPKINSNLPISLQVSRNLWCQIIKMLDGTANGDDIPNGNLYVNFSEIRMNLLVPRTFEAMKRLLIADLPAVP